MSRYQYRDRLQRKAREQGLASRAAFKLEELIARFKLVRAGDRVIDLGCAPGGWLAILAAAVGGSGRVVGVDLATCNLAAPNLVTIGGDIRDPSVCRAATDALGSAADLVTSDLAPKLSGIAERDQARSFELVDAAREFAASVLKPGGAMVAKIFMGADFAQIRAIFEADFAHTDVVRTRASRPGSSELYIVARGFRPPHSHRQMASGEPSKP
ncbi:MAG TPA: RlmE family RNA methyltransferase [Candidatus Binataceae bacterium]|nr:RlmE family RNA methyltransferase [Candidatus Binataceae bacterium]